MQLREICTCPGITCARDTSALELAQLMRDRHVGDVVVVEEHEGGATPVGIVIEVMAPSDQICSGQQWAKAGIHGRPPRLDPGVRRDDV